MSLIVKKFGGSSVADADKIRNVSNIIADTKAQGHRVVVVLSAGEQISVSLAAMCTIDHSLIDHYLSMDMVVFVAGFQGIDDKGNITTLGRGGSFQLSTYSRHNGVRIK